MYDTLEMESNLNYVEHVVSQTLKRLNTDQPLSSHPVDPRTRQTLAEEFEGPAFSKCLSENVPVYIPAFTDSEMGWMSGRGRWAKIDFTRSQIARTGTMSRFCARCTRSTWSSIPYLDLNHYAEEMLGSSRLGIFTIGGGVPRNWRSRSLRTSRSATPAWGSTCNRRGFTTVSGSALSLTIGAALSGLYVPGGHFLG